MSDGTGIEYATTTWNVTTGCTHAGGPGCDNCWAKRMSKRHRGRFGYPADDPFRPTCHPERLGEPLRWQKTRRVFVTSMGDFFHDQIPYDFVKQVFDVCWRVNSDRLNTHPTRPPHTFMFLTKRPKRMGELWRLYLKERRNWDEKTGLDYLDREVAHTLLFGTSVETNDQGHRIAELIGIPEVLHWLSLEPLLGPVKPHPYSFHSASRDRSVYGWLDWVIVGAETGPGKRPMKTEWARDVAMQCKAAGVPFFFKKDSSGSRLLDGREWNEFPQGVR